MSQYEKQIAEAVGYLTEAVRDALIEVGSVAQELRRNRNVMIELEALTVERQALLARAYYRRSVGDGDICDYDDLYAMAERIREMKED